MSLLNFLIKSLPQAKSVNIKFDDFKTIKIGNQEWMSENLNVSHFSNGDPIPHAISEKEWFDLGDKGKPAWCYYDNDPELGKTYGKLYNWYVVNDPRGLAPEGWRVPTRKDWTILTNYLGGIGVAGGKLKETGATHWKYPNTGATNETGFSALPGGTRFNGCIFCSIGLLGYWWSATSSERDSRYAAFCNAYFSDGGVQLGGSSKMVGFSVRFVRDYFV